MWNVLEKVLLIQIRETLCLRLIALESKGGYTPYIWTLSFKRRTFLLGFNQPNRYASPELGLQVISETEGSQESVSFT